MGIQCTDSWYVAHSETLLYRPGYEVFLKAGPRSDFLRVLHSSGKLTEKMVSAEPERNAFTLTTLIVLYIALTPNTQATPLALRNLPSVLQYVKPTKRAG
jgi:phosphoenolpyruvate carboxykinase (GTP)